MRIRQFNLPDQQAVIEIWSRCGLLRPWNDPVKEIARKTEVQPELFWVAEEDGVIIGTIMAGYDGHRGWLYCVGVDPSRHRGGLGAKLVAHAEEVLRALGCGKINLQVRDDNHEAAAFYESCGFVREPLLSYGKRLRPEMPAPNPEFPA